MPIGPSLPPHLAHLAARASRSPSPPEPGPAQLLEQNEDDDDDDNYGPALPPHLAAVRGKANAPSSSAPDVGPSILPVSVAGPSRLSASAGPTLRPPPPNTYDDESDDDDDVIGPQPIASGGGETRSAIQEFMEREERRRKDAEEASKPKVLQREEWMLVPPTSGVLSNVDPLRKRPTTFSRSTVDPAASTDHTIWTETPQEKQQRIADEVAGIKRKKDKAGERVLGFDEEVEERRKRRKEMEIKEKVMRHSESQRGPSLLNAHTSKLSKKGAAEEDAPAIWDHSRDMGITGRLLSDNERKEKIKEARGLGDRFGHGKAGAHSM